MQKRSWAMLDMKNTMLQEKSNNNNCNGRKDFCQHGTGISFYVSSGWAAANLHPLVADISSRGMGHVPLFTT
eukprot:755967-Amphidinium_carterae.1